MLPRILVAAVLISCATHARSQIPVERYADAHRRVNALSESPGFLLKDAPEAVAALRDQWSAVADYLIELRQHNPMISPAELDHSLCLLTAGPYPSEDVPFSAEEECKPTTGERTSVLELGPNLLLVEAQSGEIGTVFILGQHEGKPTVVWSIADAAHQPHDPDDLIEAWKLDRAEGSCRDKGSPHKPGACGPLYASIGLLPPDSQHRPRFYLDAGYSQEMGATIGAQTSIWRWDGDRASLQWIDWHAEMIDDPPTTVSWSGLLTFTYKGDFRTMFDCGSCDSRPTERRIQLQPDGLLDLGTRSLTPELDLLDTLFWRIAHRKSTAVIADPRVTRALRPVLTPAFADSRKIEPGWDSIGMIDDLSVRLTHTGAQVCLQGDSVGSTFHFTLRRTLNGGYFVSHLRILDAAPSCAQKSIFPPVPASPTPITPPTPAAPPPPSPA